MPLSSTAGKCARSGRPEPDFGESINPQTMPADPGSTNPPRLLDQVGRILDAYGARWAAIGALAVAYHGPIRASFDADALISLKGSRVDLDQLAARLRETGWKVDVREGEPGDPLGFVVRILDRAGNQVDLIGGIRKLDPEFFGRATRTTVDGMKLRFASAEDLIALKLFAGGPKDLEDAEGVIRVQAGRLDTALLRRLCKGFGARAAKACERLLGKAGQA
jgi:predicted nucleotidyltransferase